MRLREAMDAARITAPELAVALGVPVQRIRQARMDPNKSGHRSPPDGWREALVRIAADRIPELADLVAKLADPGGP